MVFVFLLVVGLMIFAPLIDFGQHRRRIAQIDQFAVPGANPSPAQQSGSENPFIQASLAITSVFVRSPRTELAIADRLHRAGRRLPPNERGLVRGSAPALSM